MRDAHKLLIKYRGYINTITINFQTSIQLHHDIDPIYAGVLSYMVFQCHECDNHLQMIFKHQ